jgi:hypothetical protein
MRCGGERTVASPRRLIKRATIRVAAFVAAVAILAPGLWAQAPDEAWRTLPTAHFRVTFPARLESLGRRAAGVAEVAYAGLSDAFVEPPSGLIDILVTDHSDESNGYATIVPSNRIVVFARPPVDGPSLTYFDDWMELVVTHELAHIVHLDYTRNPLGRLLRGVFGRADGGWPYFPGIATPGWVIEGLATWYESELTRAGRVHGSYHEMALRTAVLEGRFEGIDQASGVSPLWPAGSRPYAYGSMFFEYLLDRHGDERMTAFAEAVAGQWIPYRLNAAGRSAFGVSLSQAWREWTDSLTAHYGGLDAELSRFGPVTEPERLTDDARWAFHPSVSPDGSTLLYARADGRSDIQLERQSLAGGDPESLSRTNGLATYGWMPDGRVLFSQLEQDGPYRAYADLYLAQLGGETRRVTHGARVEQPSVAPDGTWAVAVQNVDGTNALVRVDLASGEVANLVAADASVHWAFPRLSPNGRWIAASRWQPGAYHDIVILEAASGREVQRLTRDRAVDVAPTWSPDSRWIVWSSDRTGIMNVVGAEVDPATGRAQAPRLLTNVRTGATYPSVDPSGRWLYFSGYHVDGWEAERVPFDPAGASVAPPPDERFAEASPWVRPMPAEGDVEDYSAWSTLLPRYWIPRLREPVVAGAATEGGILLPERQLLDYAVGAETSGADLVGRHAYVAYAQMFARDAKVEGGVAYAYGGFGNPILSLRAEQLWSSGGQILAGGGADTLYVLERERFVDGSVTLLHARFRRSLSMTLGGGLVWEARELLDSDLVPTSQYVLNYPSSRLGELKVAVGFSTARTFSFQTGGASGFSAAVQARSRRHLGLASADVGLVGTDRTFAEVTGRLRAYLPLWGGGHARHVLALQASGGSAFGPGAQFGHFGVGGASGAVEDLTGLELFGGSYTFLPVRGYPPSTRIGAYAWAGSAEYRFPILLVNRGLGAWPLWFDRVVGSLFVDAGNAWEPTPLSSMAASAGAEISVGIVGFWNSGLLVRTGVAAPLVGGRNPQVYVRTGVSF